MLHGALSIHLHVSPSISMSPSCCRHVCFLMPTGLSLMRAVSPFMPSVSFFTLICSFLMLSPSFSYAPWRRWDGGEGARGPSYKIRPFLVLSFMRNRLVLMLRLSFSYAPWGCLHPVVANLFFSYAVPLFFLCSMAQVGPGGGARGPSYKTRHFLVLSFMRN